MELAIAKAKNLISLHSNMANRHGLIAGATGTGKTVTLQVMAELFSSIGVPVFMADVKGDLSGISSKGEPSEKLTSRLKNLGIENHQFDSFPVQFWDIYQEKGHPVRATISDIGPILLSRILDLSETQESVLNLIFKVADEEGLLLLDLKDFKAMLNYISENLKEISNEYGLISSQSIGGIQRALISLEKEGAEMFFGEPMLDIYDMIKIDHNGKGIINILSAEKLLLNPKLYSTFLLWILSELFENLPEVGDLEKPKFIFFFDEAHLLFKDTPKVLVDKIEQVVRLIRSKGVGVYFITQNPIDIPQSILGQLGNRVQHALRAFTPQDQKAVKIAAQTFRQNPDFSTETAISELGVGEALVSFLDNDGKPQIVERAFILPPKGKIGPISDDQKSKIIKSSIIYGRYEKVIDRESAYEIIKQKMIEKQKREEMELIRKEEEKRRLQQEKEYNRSKTGQYSRQYYDYGYGRSSKQYRGQKSPIEDIASAALKSAARSVGTSVGRKIVRGILGSIL
ncbi:MAG: helicase HerA-like domain-containing protein [Exilispira sp.]